MKTLISWNISFFIFGYSLVVCRELPSPENVTLHTLNTNYVLKWDWHKGADINRTTFIAQYLPKFKISRPERKQNWKSACVVTHKHLCDFTAVQLHYYGVWMLRVRAESGGLVSRWFQIEFCPDRDALLGPPSRVDLTSVDGYLQVSITDPVTSTNSSMREFLPNLSYLTQYWKHSSQTQPKSLLHQSNLVILPELESWTWYCVRVQSHENFYNKTSVFSPTYCKQTDGNIPSWQIFLYFLLSLVLCFLLVLILSYGLYKLAIVVKNTLYPAVSLPAHIHQYLCNSPGSDIPHLLKTVFMEEHCCDRFDVISKSVVADLIFEYHSSNDDSSQGPEQGDRCYSRHSSGDSGVYSAEENSGSGMSAAQQEIQEVKLQMTGRRILPREPEDKEKGQEQEVCV